MDEVPKNKFEKLKAELDILKQKICNMDNVLNIQEDALNSISESTQSLFKDSLEKTKKTSVNEIMRRAFSKKVLPKILEK